MPLQKYKKAPANSKNRRNNNSHYKSKVVLKLQEEPLTLWKLLKGLSNDIKEIMTTSRLAGVIIPAIFIIYGLNLLGSQIIPTIQEKLQNELGHFDQGARPLVPADHVSTIQQYLSNPGAEYFAQLQNNAIQTNVLKEDPVSIAYNGTFKLSIPDLGLSNLNVRGNTESGVEEAYDKILENGLAHMKSTGLPISPVNNNIVIYGHSAGGDVYERTGDPAAAFSRLRKIKVGNNIDITIDGKDYVYKVVKTKIVNPDDVSILTGDNANTQTLTLFTCHPPGNNAQRYVVVANPVTD